MIDKDYDGVAAAEAFLAQTAPRESDEQRLAAIAHAYHEECGEHYQFYYVEVFGLEDTNEDDIFDVVGEVSLPITPPLGDGLKTWIANEIYVRLGDGFQRIPSKRMAYAPSCRANMETADAPPAPISELDEKVNDESPQYPWFWIIVGAIICFDVTMLALIFKGSLWVIIAFFVDTAGVLNAVRLMPDLWKTMRRKHR